MTAEQQRPHFEAPRENFSIGLEKVDIPELGNPTRGKVRDIWVIPQKNTRVLVTTDRQSSGDQVVGVTPDKGRALNLGSAYWFQRTSDIIPNHVISVPHPNVTIAKEAVATLPVEVIVRGYMARTDTKTSIYVPYMEGKRNIYGIDFPEGMRPNQELPMGTIVTPTTKADKDVPLTANEAQELVDGKLGKGIWNQAKEAAIKMYERGRQESKSRGLILVDTKYEFGLDTDGQLMVIDEMHSPDSSRYWLDDTYEEKFERGETPETFDKQILRDWLAEHGFVEKGDPIPVIDPRVIQEMAEAYKIPYRMITGSELPTTPESTPQVIREAVLSALSR